MKFAACNVFLAIFISNQSKAGNLVNTFIFEFRDGLENASELSSVDKSSSLIDLQAI